MQSPPPFVLAQAGTEGPQANGKIMDALSLFGVFAVTAMLVFYALEDYSRWFILAFAGACVLASLYGFLQGAWPFGIIEAVWAGVATHRWRNRMLTSRAA